MVTLKDIAKESGVSSTTVSYVVNGEARSVLPATRDRVLQAVHKLGYFPNTAARSLMGKRTRTFGVVFPHAVAAPFDNQYFAAVLTGIIDEATACKQIPMLFTGMSWEEAESKLPLFCDGRCDGFLFVAPPPGSRLVQQMVEQNKRLVLLGTRAPGVAVSTIDVDNFRACRLATNYLLDLGHRRIGIIHADLHCTSIPDRVAGFRAAMTERGIPQTHSPSVCFDHRCDSADESGSSYKVAHQFLQSPVGASLTAIVGTHDLSVVGFDDLPFATDVTPAMTTIRQPLREIGAAAVSCLLDRIEGETTGPSEKLFDVHLVERSSTMRPKQVSTSSPYLVTSP
jgi:DNA-binding LacI/PurR family transcriptional regulator